MPRQWTWYHPASLDEAAALLAEHGEAATLVAGGTAICLSPPRRDGLAMIDLGRAGGAAIEAEGEGVRVGAMATPTALARAGLLDRVGSGMLREAGASVGPRPVRNRATLGGNVIRAFPWSDLPVPLLALDATFLLRSSTGTRRLSADALFVAQPRVALEDGELLEAALVRADRPGEGGAFLKLAQTAVEHALVSVAVRLRLEGDRCAEARVVAGALSALPQRLEGVEAALVGSAVDDAALARAAEAARGARVNRDRRASDETRLDLAAVLTRRALAAARDRARNGGEAS